MGKASTSKRIQRASGVKKAAMRGKRPPYGFYALIAVLVVAGVGGIALARNGSGTGAGGESPGLNDHWHTAYAIDICGTIQPNLPQPASKPPPAEMRNSRNDSIGNAGSAAKAAIFPTFPSVICQSVPLPSSEPAAMSAPSTVRMLLIAETTPS